VFSGMIGVTVFGLIFTPVFYVVSRWLAQLGKKRRGAAPPAPSTTPPSVSAGRPAE
jgi:hypothetical protein